jgi:hypothetical protein
MSIARRLKTDCTIVRRSVVDDESFDQETKPEEVETKCSLQQQRRDENSDRGEVSETVWNLFLPHGAEIDTGDAVRVKGKAYEVKGEPWSAEEGSRSMWHVEATVSRVTGTDDEAGS